RDFRELEGPLRALVGGHRAAFGRLTRRQQIEGRGLRCGTHGGPLLQRRGFDSSPTRWRSIRNEVSAPAARRGRRSRLNWLSENRSIPESMPSSKKTRGAKRKTSRGSSCSSKTTTTTPT